jgi:hypothetical protein
MRFIGAPTADSSAALRNDNQKGKTLPTGQLFYRTLWLLAVWVFCSEGKV